MSHTILESNYLSKQNVGLLGSVARSESVSVSDNSEERLEYLAIIAEVLAEQKNHAYVTNQVLEEYLDEDRLFTVTETGSIWKVQPQEQTDTKKQHLKAHPTPMVISPFYTAEKERRGNPLFLGPGAVSLYFNEVKVCLFNDTARSQVHISGKNAHESRDEGARPFRNSG